jgi:alcohol dehydrogenase class IV
VSAGFEFATATRIVFGAGKLAQLPAEIAAFAAGRVLLVSGQRDEPAAGVERTLLAAGHRVTRLRVAGEPTVEWVRSVLPELADVQAVVGLGGGSVIDAGKALAALAANGGDPLDYLEVIGRGQPLERPSLPFIAVPTTAGTGAEVTRNAVLGSEREQVKASLRSPSMLPRLALVDPELLRGAPPAVLRSSGLDALSQLIEPFVSARRNPLTDALARDGIRRSARSLRRAVAGADEAALREDLALASLCGGLCLANAGLGAVHGFAAPVGGMFRAPHGAVCAALLPHVLEINLRALQARMANDEVLDRYRELAVLLTEDAAARAQDAVAWVRALCSELGVPGLAAYGMQAKDVDALVAKAKLASSMKANAIALRDEELAEIATRAL